MKIAKIITEQKLMHTGAVTIFVMFLTAVFNSRSIKKRELVNVYREDFQSILPKQRPFPFFCEM